MPLDGLAGQWGQFGTEAATAHAFQATSRVFAALAQETDAREIYLIAWRRSQAVDLTDLGHTLDTLLQAWQHWTDAMLSLEFVALEAGGNKTAQEAMRLLITQVMEQRVRLSMLLQEIAREHLLAYRGLPAAPQREEARR